MPHYHSNKNTIPLEPLCGEELNLPEEEKSGFCLQLLRGGASELPAWRLCLGPWVTVGGLCQQCDWGGVLGPRAISLPSAGAGDGGQTCRQPHVPVRVSPSEIPGH